MTTQAPALDIDPFSDEFLADPYPFHETLRETGPVVWLDRYGIFAAARHAEVQTALQDWRTFSSAAGVGLANLNKDEVFRPRSIMLEVDPPLHDRRGRCSRSALSPAVIRALRPRFEAEARRSWTAGARQLRRRHRSRGGLSIRRCSPTRWGCAPDGRENLLPYAAVVFNDFGPRNQLFEETRRDADAVRDWVIAQCNRAALRPGSNGAGCSRPSTAASVARRKRTSWCARC